MVVMDDGFPTCWQGLDLGLCFLTPKYQLTETLVPVFKESFNKDPWFLGLCKK